jgi:anti-sigma factor RsiW
MTSEREDRLQLYLDRRLPPEEQRAFEAELLEDPALAAEAYDELAVREALAERTTARRQGRGRARRLVPAMALAAAACVAVVLLVREPEPEPPRLRGRRDAAPQAVAPLGKLASPPTIFRWTSDSRADRYRLEVFDAAGARIFVGTTPDTALVLTLPAELDAGTWRATSLDSIGVGFRGTGRIEFRRH